ncbi:MAG: oligoendopeptidase F, partial [Lactobacillus iners]|nr:oligoendopeptidase F [Lactobacillus iners]
MATPYRKDVEVDLTWDLTRIFKNDQEWEKEFAKIQQEIAELTTLKGKLSTSGTDLYENFSKILKVSREIEKVYVYSTLSSDQDTNNSHYLGFVARVQSLYNDFSAATAFVDPEILDIPEKTIEQFKKDEPRLAEFAHRLDTLNQKRKHTLSSDQEKIIAAASDALNTSENTYNILTNSDMEY